MGKDDANSHMPHVCAIVPVRNRKERFPRFIEGFKNITYPNKDLVIVDDGSTDGTREMVINLFPEITLLPGSGNMWWSGATNMGIKYALKQGTDYILTINDDVEMEADFLTKMMEIALVNDRSIVGCRIHWQDDTKRIWAIGASAIFSRGEIYRLNYYDRIWSDVEGALNDPFRVDTMPGNGTLIPRNAFEEVGFYDEKWMPQYHGDSDFVMRAAKKGYKPLISLKSLLYNHRSTEPLAKTKKELIFSKKSGFYWRAIMRTLFRHGSKVRFIPDVFLTYRAGFKTLPRPEKTNYEL